MSNIDSFKGLVIMAKDLTDMHNNFDTSTAEEKQYKQELISCIKDHNKEYNDILSLELFAHRYYITKKRGGLI